MAERPGERRNRRFGEPGSTSSRQEGVGHSPVQARGHGAYARPGRIGVPHYGGGLASRHADWNRGVRSSWAECPRQDGPDGRQSPGRIRTPPPRTRRRPSLPLPECRAGRVPAAGVGERGERPRRRLRPPRLGSVCRGRRHDRTRRCQPESFAAGRAARTQLRCLRSVRVSRPAF